jgi:hypothetical protein
MSRLVVIVLVLLTFYSNVEPDLDKMAQDEADRQYACAVRTESSWTEGCNE